MPAPFARGARVVHIITRAPFSEPITPARIGSVVSVTADPLWSSGYRVVVRWDSGRRDKISADTDGGSLRS